MRKEREANTKNAEAQAAEERVGFSKRERGAGRGAREWGGGGKGKGERRRERLTCDTRMGDDVSEAPSSHRHHRQAGGHGF